MEVEVEVEVEVKVEVEVEMEVGWSGLVGERERWMEREKDWVGVRGVDVDGGICTFCTDTDTDTHSHSGCHWKWGLSQWGLWRLAGCIHTTGLPVMSDDTQPQAYSDPPR